MTARQAIPLPDQLPAAHSLIQKLHFDLQQAQWKIQQLEKKLYGPSSDRVPPPQPVPQEQGLWTIFPQPADPPATEHVILPEEKADPNEPKRPARNPQPRVVETITERIEP